MTVITLFFDTVKQEWMPCGKVRSHYKPIRDIMFSPYKPEWKLMTVSEDRCLVEYHVEAGYVSVIILLFISYYCK